MDLDQRIRIWRTKYALVTVPILLYLLLRFQVTKACLCQSEGLTKTILRISIGSVVILAILAGVEIIREGGAMAYRGESFLAPNNAKVWASGKDVNYLLYVGMGLGSCALIEIIMRIC